MQLLFSSVIMKFLSHLAVPFLVTRCSSTTTIIKSEKYSHIFGCNLPQTKDDDDNDDDVH